MHLSIKSFLLLLVLPVLIWVSCSKKMVAINNNEATADSASFWLSTPDQSALLSKLNTPLVFATVANGLPTITVNPDQQYQTMDGFGFTLTGGSATLINNLSPATRNNLLQELFSTNDNAVGISYLRISIGASDLNPSVFTYDDMPAGQTDTALQHFSLQNDKQDLIPVLKQIIAINPNIKILGSPWTPPVWMKTNGSSVGGNLKPEYYGVYANYFVKYIQGMAAEGIKIDAITPQNEPLNPKNNPSLEMSALEQADFIKTALGPKLQAAGLKTKIVIYDHNADRPDYPLTVLNDAAARPYIDGSGFHLYDGPISALTPVHDAYPDKNIYFTEQYTASTGTFSGDLMWHVKNLVIGAPRNWSKNVLEWNLANDVAYGPHTPGGCTTCKGAITISGETIIRNVGYYIIAHASKFVPAGSVRIGSNIVGNFSNVAYITPQGKKVLIVENENTSPQSFNISFQKKWVTATLGAGAVGTFVW